MDRDENASINIKTWGKDLAFAMGIQITDRAGTSQISNLGIIKPGDSDAYFGGSLESDYRCASMTQEYLSIGLEAATSLESQ
jgi:hypothetical protein